MIEIIIEYRGFRLVLGFNSEERKFTMTMKKKYSYNIMLGSDVYGNIKRINNALETIKDKIPDEKLRIEDLEKQLENAKIEMQKPFPQEDLLNEKMKRLEELNILLKLEEKEKQVLDTSNEEELEKCSPNKYYER